MILDLRYKIFYNNFKYFKFMSILKFSVGGGTERGSLDQFQAIDGASPPATGNDGIFLTNGE